MVRLSFVVMLQRMLGHTHLKTAERYLHVVVDPSQKIRNPFDDAPAL